MVTKLFAKDEPGVWGSVLRASQLGTVVLVILTAAAYFIDGDPLPKALVWALLGSGTFTIGAFTADVLKK